MKLTDHYYRRMRLHVSRTGVVAAVLAIAVGCSVTKPNPLYCGDGNCTDPEHPFCDVDGSLSGIKNNCIAVTCTPDEFAECRGDVAITCNSDGNNYDELQCAKGCDPNAHGCRVCDANQTVCANGVTQTCDANGNVVTSETCALGCFEDQPRCRELDPSNGLATYFDMVSDPPDLDLGGGGQIDTSTGTITSGTSQVPVPTFLVASTPSSPQIRIYVAKKVILGNVTVKNDDVMFGGPAIAFLAKSTLELSGKVLVRSGDLAQGCLGGRAQVSVNVDGDFVASGSGGGGHATAGGTGGGANGVPTTAAGSANGTATLVPLRGGCASGGADENGIPQATVGVRGGGAIQLVSRVAISVSGDIDANGNDAYDLQTSNAGAYLGGGAGGGILMEAPTISVGPSAVVTALGSNGAGCDPAKDTCVNAIYMYGTGGAAATPQQPAANGGASTGMFGGGGGGGGGLGRIRINTPDGTFGQSNTSTLAGSLTTGQLSTR